MNNVTQQHIANHTEGPVLVIAGPGPGKTKTLVDRIVNLVKKGVEPEAIMVGAFTEKTAKELITHISNKLLEDGIRVNFNEIYVGMLHSIFLRFLEESREYTRLKCSYRLFDQFKQIFMIFQQAKKEYAKQIAAASKMEYIIVPGKQVKEDLVM